MAEDEVGLGLEPRPLVVQLEFRADALGEWDGAAGATGLGRAELAARVVAAHTHHARDPVDVQPPQGEEFAAAKPGHRCGHVQDALGWASVVDWRRREQRLELLHVEKADVHVASAARLLSATGFRAHQPRLTAKANIACSNPR